jgi:hypothetical protein
MSALYFLGSGERSTLSRPSLSEEREFAFFFKLRAWSASALFFQERVPTLLASYVGMFTLIKKAQKSLYAIPTDVIRSLNFHNLFPFSLRYKLQINISW